MIFSKVNNMYELLGYDHMFGKHVAPLPHAILCMICHCVYGLVADESPLCFSMRRPHCIWCHQIYVFTQIAMRSIACFHFTPLAADNICHPIRIMPKRAAGCNVGFEKHLKRSCLLVALSGFLISLVTLRYLGDHVFCDSICTSQHQHSSIRRLRSLWTRQLLLLHWHLEVEHAL